MSQDLESFCLTNRLARPTATSLSQPVDHREALGIAKVVQDLSLAGRDPCSAKGAGVFRLLDGGTNNRDAGGVDRDGRVHEAQVPETT